MRVAAVILAGGRAERLGGTNKALLDIGGRRMIDRVLDSAAGCDPLLLAVGRTPFAVEGLRSVPDLATGISGPLAGVAAAVDALTGTDAEFLLSLAGDAPFAPPDFLDRAVPLIDAADAVLGAYRGQDYPTNALWRLSALRAQPSAQSLKHLAATLRTVHLDYAAFATADPFANANTPQDLADLRARTVLDVLG